MTALEVVRYGVFAVFAASALVAVGGWAVRSRKVNPFGPAGRFLRGSTDPFLKPVEQWLVKNGGNPQAAGWWLFGVTLVGGIIVVSFAAWMASQARFVSFSARSGQGLVRMI